MTLPKVDEGIRTEGESLSDLTARFEGEIKAVRTEEELARLKASYLGKAGFITLRLRELGHLPVESRPLFGAHINELKTKIEAECCRLQEGLNRRKRERKIQEEAVDITLPGRAVERGRLHPISRVLEEVEDLFREIGFNICEGPEIETDFFNFEALNIPKDHPARDMQDTFYLGVATRTAPPNPPAGPFGPAQPDPHGAPLLLRTHTSPVQIHVMKKRKPPIRMIAPGVVYRRDSDISHTPMFHQVEGLVVEEGSHFSDLKGVVLHFLQRFFGASYPVRFRPSYFPFTEPSAEVDIGCIICGGKKKLATGISCRLCKETGWLEVMGCGMIDPAVFENVGYDPAKVSGFAFGMGIERLTMLKFGIPDIRLFFENDLRFLKQF